MRISRLPLAGLAALISAGAKDAFANDVTISTATTTPLQTSSPDGVSPGDVTIAANGSIAVSAGQTAVTVNSNNDVTLNGRITSENADNTAGIVILGGNTGSITSSSASSISLLETYTQTDSDNDGDLDGSAAIGTNRFGVRLNSGAAFTGDILLGGGISVEGNNSGAIRLDAPLTGDLTSTGALSVVGDNSIGVNIAGGAAGGVSGDVIVRGAMNVRGADAAGLVIGAPVGGEVRVSGAWAVSGYNVSARPVDVSKFDADDRLQSRSAVEVRYSVAGGVTIEGTGVEDDVDDDGDGVTEADGDTNDDASASIAVLGSAPAILISADPSANLTLGPNAKGFGLHVRGAVGASGLFDGVNATGVRIEGGGASTATIAGGVAIDAPVTVSAAEADAFGLHLGAGASTPSILVRRSLSSSVLAETARDAYGVFIASGANAPSLANSGTLRAQLLGELGDATAIIDRSNTLSTITNSGTIEAVVAATDTDPTDNVPPPPVTGRAIAIDVSTSTIAVTLNQIADVPFTDDDSVDNDVNQRPPVRIVGDILFGAGADAFNLLSGTVAGDISFGAGADAFVINNGASFTGRLSDSDGALSINVVNGALNSTGGQVNVTSASFGAAATLGVSLSQTPGASTRIIASGPVSFASGARVRPTLPAGLPASGSVTFLTALGGLTGASNVTGPASGEGVPYLYNLNIGLVSGDPNSLEASFALKTPAQLGLTANQSAAFDPIMAALRHSDEASAAAAALADAYDFQNAYEDLLPSYSSAAAEVAATAIQQAQSAATNRLAATRLHEVERASAWAQEIGYALTREAPTANGQDYRGQGFGVAAGIDAPLDNGALFGVAASFVTSEVEEPGRPQGEISAWIAQLNAYLGTAMGPVDLDFVAGFGGGKMRSRRFIEIGDDFSTNTEADWWAYEGHASARASLPLAVSDWLVVTPQAALTYVGLNEEGYAESGAGAAFDYEADSVFSQRLWGDAGLEASLRFNTRGGGVIAPRIFAGYRANLIDEEAERSFRFASGGQSFTLRDDALGDGAPLVGIGIDAHNGYSTLSIAYEGEFGDQTDRHSLNTAVRFRF